MNSLKHFLAIPAAMALFACGGEVQDTTVEEAPAAETCLYSHNPDSTTLKWTAFKTSERIGVSGGFDKMEISGTVASENPMDVYANANFIISTASVNSNAEDRDKKITEHFFGSMNTPGTIEGQVIGLSAGKVEAVIAMNGVKETTELTLNLEGDRLTLTGMIMMENWDALASVDSLNTICYDLHTGADGESKLWQEVELEISTTLKKDCK